MNTGKTIRLGYIGTGIAPRDLHWPAILQLENKFSITAVCNRTRNKAEDFAALTGAKTIYENAEQLLLDDAIDAVVITTPIELNFEMALMALQSNKHLLIEKPLASSVAEAKMLVRQEEGHEKVAMLAENFRYHPAIREIKQLIDINAIGQIHSFFWNGYSLLIPGDKYATPWRLHNQYPGGYVMDGGIHNIAALRMLFGEPSQTSSVTKTINPAIGTIDTLNAQFAYAEDIHGQLNLCFSSKGYLENKLVIMGTEGTVIFENDSVTVLRDKNEVISVSNYDFFDSYRNQFDDFYNAICNHTTPVSTFDEGLKDIQLMMKLIDK